MLLLPGVENTKVFPFVIVKLGVSVFWLKPVQLPIQVNKLMVMVPTVLDPEFQVTVYVPA